MRVCQALFDGFLSIEEGGAAFGNRGIRSLKGKKGLSSWVSMCEACAFRVFFFPPGDTSVIVVNSKPATVVLPSHESVFWCPSELRCLFPLSDVSHLDLSPSTPYVF